MLTNNLCVLGMFTLIWGKACVFIALSPVLPLPEIPTYLIVWSSIKLENILQGNHGERWFGMGQTEWPLPPSEARERGRWASALKDNPDSTMELPIPFGLQLCRGQSIQWTTKPLAAR